MLSFNSLSAKCSIFLTRTLAKKMKNESAKDLSKKYSSHSTPETVPTPAESRNYPHKFKRFLMFSDKLSFLGNF